MSRTGSPLPQFGLISELDPGRPETWEGRVFLTLDIDWAPDAVIADAIELIESYGVCATWFVTHDTPLLKRLRANRHFELGIHPNFNFLLEGDPRNGANAEEVVDRLLALVPGACSVRSHAVVQGSPLIHLFARKGLTHDCNPFIPEHVGIELRPWHWFGLTEVPYCWEDDVCCVVPDSNPIVEVAARPGLRVFDFHPIHVFLNTECMSRYQAARDCFADASRLIERRNIDKPGTRDWLTQLLETAQ